MIIINLNELELLMKIYLIYLNLNNKVTPSTQSSLFSQFKNNITSLCTLFSPYFRVERKKRIQRHNALFPSLHCEQIAILHNDFTFFSNITNQNMIYIFFKYIFFIFFSYFPIHKKS